VGLRVENPIIAVMPENRADDRFDACSEYRIADPQKNIHESMTEYIRDNGGRRLGIDRRQFSYDEHIPERRSLKDRRSGIDRRLKPRIPKGEYS
jgi:hypothetical protein